MTKILLIEDMKGVRDSLEMILGMAGFSVRTEKDGLAGLKAAQSGQFDLVITDILMPEMDGSEVILSLSKSNPDLPIIAISGGGNGVDAKQALILASQLAQSVLEKPFSRDELITAVKKAVGEAA